MNNPLDVNKDGKVDYKDFVDLFVPVIASASKDGKIDNNDIQIAVNNILQVLLKSVIPKN